jgi:hypothetical protein
VTQDQDPDYYKYAVRTAIREMYQNLGWKDTFLFIRGVLDELYALDNSDLYPLRDKKDKR